MTAKDIIKSALAAYGAYKLFAQDGDDASQNDKMPFAIRPSSDDEVIYVFKVKIDKNEYKSTTYPNEGAGAVKKNEKNDKSEEKVEKAIEASASDSAITMDSASRAVAEARRQCEASIEQCRARNKMACPYHGSQIVKSDILAHFQQMGINEIPEVVAEKDNRGRATGSYIIKVPCADNEASRTAMENAINSFLSRPGVDQQSVGDAEFDFIDNIHEEAEPDENGNVPAAQSGYLSLFDVDELDPEAETDAAAHVENQERADAGNGEAEHQEVATPEMIEEAFGTQNETGGAESNPSPEQTTRNANAEPVGVQERGVHPAISAIADRLMGDSDIAGAFGSRDALIDALQEIKDSEPNRLNAQNRLLRAYLNNVIAPDELNAMMNARSESAVTPDRAESIMDRIVGTDDDRNVDFDPALVRGVLAGTRSTEEAMNFRNEIQDALENENLSDARRQTYLDLLNGIDQAYGFNQTDEEPEEVENDEVTLEAPELQTEAAQNLGNALGNIMREEETRPDQTRTEERGTAERPASAQRTNAEISADVNDALSRLANHWGASHRDRIFRGITDALEGNANSDVDAYLNEAEGVVGADHPVMRAIRNRMNGASETNAEPAGRQDLETGHNTPQQTQHSQQQPASREDNNTGRTTEDHPRPIGRDAGGRRVYEDGTEGMYVPDGMGGYSQLTINPATGEVMREEDIADDEFEPRSRRDDNDDYGMERNNEPASRRQTSPANANATQANNPPHQNNVPQPRSEQRQTEARHDAPQQANATSSNANSNAQRVAQYDANQSIPNQMKTDLMSEVTRANRRMGDLFNQAGGSAANDAGKAAHRMSSYLSNLKRMLGVDRNGQMQASSPSDLMNRVREQVLSARNETSTRRNQDGTTRRIPGYDPSNGHESTKYKRAKDAARFVASILGQRISIDDAAGTVNFEFTGDGTRPGSLHYETPESFAAYRDSRRSEAGQTAYTPRQNAAPATPAATTTPSARAPEPANAPAAANATTPQQNTGTRRTYFQTRSQRQNQQNATAPAANRNEQVGQRLDNAVANGGRSQWANGILSRVRDRARNANRQ